MAHRLWFRLDDVLPIAEHAMACFTHRISRAQTKALAPNGPALIWTGIAVLDQLTSNGVPAWYGQRGTIHAADAYTWRNSSGRYGTVRRDGYDTAYLPLTAADGSTGQVIEQLRRARHSGHSWVTVDIDHTDGHRIGADRVHTHACRHDLVPAGTPWTEANVTCHDVNDQPYPALVAYGYTSDAGHLLARFDRPTIERLVADLDLLHANLDLRSDVLPGEYPVLRLADGVLSVIEQQGGRAEAYRTTDHISPDSDGYYPLGAYLWPWRQATTPATASEGARPL